MIHVEKIAGILGLSRQIHSLFDLNESITHGLPKTSLRATVSHLTQDTETARQISNRLISSATFKRRRSVLNPQESERVERLARVYATALDIWGNRNDARLFLFTPHQLLKQQRPIDLAFTELGARQIEQILEDIRYGLPV